MDVVNRRLAWLRVDLEATTDCKAQTELRHKIAFAEAIIRMRDDLDHGRDAPDPVPR